MINTRYFFNRFYQLLLALGFIFLMVACGGNEKPNEDLQQAFKLHEEAMKIRNQAGDRLTLLMAQADSLVSDNLDSLNLSLKAWDEQIVEVPGFEEEHDHEGHDHHHDEGPELTPEQHLQVQQHLLKEIQALAKSIEEINNK